MKIIKRSGEEQNFDREKIVTAISKANRSVKEDQRIPDSLINHISRVIEAYGNTLSRALSVEEIQDRVETELMKAEAYDLAKAYITYRFQRALIRQANTTDEQILSLIECNNEEAKQENSNKNPVINSVQRDYMAGEVSKDITKRILLPEDIVEAHEQGLIHFHDMDYYAQHMHNCFHGSTRFITDTGIRSFNEFHDGDTVFVKDRFGETRQATVHKYGSQKMQVVTLKNSKMERTVRCTPDHRWYLADGSVTTSLKVGDRLLGVADNSKFVVDTYEKACAFCIGFAVGDGVDLKDGGTRVRLCGKKREFASIFRKAGWSVTYPESARKDPVAYSAIPVKQNFLEGKGWRFATPDMKAMYFHGLYSADGTRNGNRIATADPRVETFIVETSGMAGMYVSSRVKIAHNTNYKDNARLVYYHFVRSTPDNWYWRVVDISPDSHPEYIPEAWCVEEPVTHSFLLDGGIVTGNCDLVNLEEMLQNGTVISGTMIEKPHSFSTACNITTQLIAQIASNQYGGQSITLTHLAPFVQVSREKFRKEVRKELQGIDVPEERFNDIVETRVRREIAKGVQTIQYQVVTLLTTNGQAPFITVFMYLGEARSDQERHDLAMIIEEVLKQRYQGVKNEVGVYVSPAFPKLIYVLEEQNIHPDSPYYYLTKRAAACTARRLVPDYISEKIMKQNKIDKNGVGHCYTCMGCRSFLTPYLNKDGNFQTYGRFNQGVVTVNLVDIGLSAGKDLDRFWQIFDERMELCHKALQCRHERLTGTKSDAAPILWQHGALLRLKKGEVIDSYLHGGYSTLSLGYAGLWECVFALIGKKLTEPEGEVLGLAIMRKLNEYTAKWKAAENIDYSLYGTPMESTTYRFAKCLQQRFGIVPGVTDRNYITNSYHVHVTEPIDAFSKLELEAKFQALSPGGAISYVEVPNMQNNVEAVLAVMEFIYDHIMYAELNTKSDYCMVCGFDGEIQIAEQDGKLIWRCPKCGNTDQDKMNVMRRTCGYCGTQYWNQGRTAEIRDRVLHL